MFKKILVPIDVSHESSTRALPVAVELARPSGGRLRLMNVQAPVPAAAIPYMPADFEHQSAKDAENQLRALISENDISAIADATVRLGTVYREVLDEAKSMAADLIVVASHHPGIADYLLGSNAASIVRHADCSVFVVRD